MTFTAKTMVERLLAKAIPLENGCLQCHLAPNAKGYSPVGFGGRGAKKWRAHRLVYTVLVDEVPGHLMVLHSCDNRRCINIEHLFVGTAKDNTQDMMQKGRHKYITHRKMTAEKYNLARVLEAQGLSKFEIAEKLNVHYETVRAYLNGEKAVDEPLHRGYTCSVGVG